MILSPQQQKAFEACQRWKTIDADKDPEFIIDGYAGTGKTEIAKRLAEGEGWLFGAFTGKAAHVLRQRGCWGAKTLHSLIYRPTGESKETEIRQLEAKIAELELSQETPFDQMPEDVRERLKTYRQQIKALYEENKNRFALWANSPLAEPDCPGIIVDEMSMVDKYLGRDLLSFGKKILLLGDSAQLPPVGGSGYFTDMEPDVRLTEIHRQAADSPILRLATHVRMGEDVRTFESVDDCEIIFRGDKSKAEMAEIMMRVDQVLVGRNATRLSMNRRYRELLGRTTHAPQPEDRLVCLRNDHKLGLFNGSQWIVDKVYSVDTDGLYASVRVVSDEDGRGLDVEMWLHHMFGRADELSEMGFKRRDFSEFDYAYMLTVHKAQGSQWNSVLLVDESSQLRSAGGRRWLYTGVTRAAKRLVVLT